MAVVEELVAKLGFKVDGLGDLKKFDKGLESTKKKLADFGTSMNKNLTSRLGGAAAGGVVAKIGDGMKTAAVAVGTFTRAMAGVAVVALSVTAAVAGIAIGALKLAHSFMKARAEAAAMRRELQLSAKGQRTTAINIDNVGAGFRAMGMKAEEAKTAIGEVYGKVNEAIKEGDGDAGKWFKKNKIATMDKRGNQRDTAAVLDDIVKTYFDQRNRRDKARGDADSDPSNKKKLAAANKSELEFRKSQDEFPGLTQGIRDHLAAVKSYEDYVQKRQKFIEANPGKTKAEEDRAASIADKWQKFDNALEGLTTSITRPFNDLANAITDNVLPPLTRFAEALTSILKAMGIAPKTKGEVDAENAARANAVAGAKNPNSDASKALKKADQTKSILDFLWPSDLVQKASQYRSAVKTAGMINNDPKASQSYKDYANTGLAEAAKALIEAAGKLSDIKSEVSPQSNMKKVEKDKAPVQNVTKHISDVGNDHRNMPVSVTVNATGLEAVAAKLKGAVLGAIAAKGANVNTGAATAP